MKTFYSHLDYAGRGTMTFLCSEIYGLKEVQDPKFADLIVWNGGEDIGTSIYLEQPIDRRIPFKKSNRDLDEIELFSEYKNDKSKLLLGICRGAQLLNCLNGGRLYQDVNGHHASHRMIDLQSGEELNVTSTHHQQMIAAPLAKGRSDNGQIIGVSSESTYRAHEGGSHTPTTTKDLRHGADVEIMWYPKTHSLCIQGHPEYVPGLRFAEYTRELMDRLISKESISFAA